MRGNSKKSLKRGMKDLTSNGWRKHWEDTFRI